MVLGLPEGAGRFIPRTMIRCISVLLSSEKILKPRSKERAQNEGRWQEKVPSPSACCLPRGEVVGRAGPGKPSLSGLTGAELEYRPQTYMASSPEFPPQPRPSSELLTGR